MWPMPTAIVHGWHDDDRAGGQQSSVGRESIERRCTYSTRIIDLEDQIGVICILLRNFLIAL